MNKENLEYSKFFQIGPVASGRTYAICQAARSIKATIVVNGIMQANELTDRYSVPTVVLQPSIEIMLGGQRGPFLVDHSAMLEICGQYETCIRNLMKNMDGLRVQIFNLEHPEKPKEG